MRPGPVLLLARAEMGDQDRRMPDGLLAQLPHGKPPRDAAALGEIGDPRGDLRGNDIGQRGKEIIADFAHCSRSPSRSETKVSISWRSSSESPR